MKRCIRWVKFADYESNTALQSTSKVVSQIVYVVEDEQLYVYGAHHLKVDEDTPTHSLDLGGVLDHGIDPMDTASLLLLYLTFPLLTVTPIQNA